MKRILKIAALALIVLASSLPNTASAQYNDDGYGDQGYVDQGYDEGNGNRDVDYQTFYDELSPHGRWVDYPGRGYVWIPDAGPDFRPYSTNGHWVYSENYEWMWVSDYDWGWAPFHYGRWDNDPSYGWYWVPGYEWSPAWVAWRDGGDYYGWAPIRPGINININFNIGGYAPPVDFWCFAPRRYISSPRIYDYCVPYRQNTTIINHTTIIVNNYRYGGNYGFRSGPRRYDAERYTGRINPVRFRQSNTPGRSTFRNNEVSIFRPNVRRDNNRTVAPRSFERFDRNNANSNNGFRRNNGNNDVVRRNDNTPGRVGSNDNNRFERRENTPGRVGSNDNRFERRNTDPREPQNNGNSNNPGNRRFERNDNNVPTPDRERRVNTPSRDPNQGNNPVENRRFERRTENNGNSNNPVRQQQVERRQPQPQQQMERRQQQPQQQQQRQFERRQEPRPQQQQRQQVERRQEPRTEQSTGSRGQQPSRSIERRDNGSSNQEGSGNRNKENGKGRRF